ncbi:hypothetical protein [Saccharopolyspora spinosa]|uniref:hypothetical protein n=1 Tax=Saccharopolyspora spinosa TaxID=60894 RepID=UPI0002378FC4|nr:hypothetical protein [Saccharopolyspora spinosa]
MGTLAVARQILAPARSPEQSVVVVTTAENSSSENTIKLLGRSARAAQHADPLGDGPAVG